MKLSLPKKFDFVSISSIAIPILFFGMILALKIPYPYTRVFSRFSFILLISVLVIYYLTYKLPARFIVLAGLGFTLLLCALTLSYRWSSGFSDNFLIGGLLPYKDAKNYYLGANLLLNGLPLENAGQATERPLFPSFLSLLLFLSKQNLQVSLAILTLLAGAGLYFSSIRVLGSFGPASASLYSALMFIYIQSWLGYTMSELYGFIMGCLAFSVIWSVAHKFKWFDFVLGLLALLIAVSARAGAFIILPMLALWAGWILRGNNRFSFRTGAYAVLIIVAGYFLVNSVYGKLVGVPEGSSFGNFAYALYGQVRGGTGWHSAIEELGTRNQSVVYRAALQFFLAHPFSLLIAFAKSYRDFFLPGYSNIFPFDVPWQPAWLTYILWTGFMVSLIWAIVLLLRNFRLNLSSLLVTGFTGILLSIPFLPPIDGGSRFHASTVPFMYIIPAVGVSKLLKQKPVDLTKTTTSTGLRLSTSIIVFLTIVAPLLIYSFSTKPETGDIACSSGQEAFTIKVNPSSHIDLIQGGRASCGFSPAICLDDFETHNTEISSDDFYQFMLSRAQEMDIRVIPAINFKDDEFRYFFVRPEMILNNRSQGLLSGCATEILTRNQQIYLVESIVPKD